MSCVRDRVAYASASAARRPATPDMDRAADRTQGRQTGRGAGIRSHRRAVPSAAMDEPDAVPDTPTARTVAIVASPLWIYPACHHEDRPPAALVVGRRPEAR